MGTRARVDLPIGTKAKFGELHVQVVDGWGCSDCPLRKTKECLENRLACFNYHRADSKNVHFEEVKDGN